MATYDVGVSCWNPPHLMDLDSIDLIAPDSKMVDEFYGRRLISLGDLDNVHHVSMHPEDSPIYRSVSGQIGDIIARSSSDRKDVVSQHPTIESLGTSVQPPSSETGRDASTTAQRTEKRSSSRPTEDPNGNSLAVTTADAKLFEKFEMLDEYDVAAFLENEPSHFSQDFFEPSNSQIQTVSVSGTSPQRPSQLEADGRQTDRSSWSAFFAANGLTSVSFPATLDDEVVEFEPTSGILTELTDLADDEEIVEFGEECENDDGPTHMDQSSNITATTHPSCPLASKPSPGYPGRFSMSHAEQLTYNNDISHRYTFGLTCHPNGRIVHKAFVRDPHYRSTMLGEAEIMQDVLLGAAIRHAEITAARLEPLKQIRTLQERALRREIHRECALARLEGVSVGYYRYFAGHMTVEEYLAARLCVCWNDCFCDKLCTRFGDMLCPCSKNLELCD